MGKMQRLLAMGYFPSQLPPGFTSRNFAAKSREISHSAAWKTEPLKFPTTVGEPFSVGRIGHRRRQTSIQNPVSQYLLCREIVLHWRQLKRHFDKSKLGLSTPRFRKVDDGRAIPIPTLHELHEEKVSRSAGYKYLLRTDISRFFPTIYTHTVPWALHSKGAAKRNRRDMTAAFFGNRIDAALQKGQDGQTFGIPIGPDTSHIVAEVIASAVDQLIRDALKEWPAGFRYVDDYYLFFANQLEAESALATVAKCMQQYELQVNFEKTAVKRVHEFTEDYWTHRLRGFEIAPAGSKQRADLSHYFDLALAMSREVSDESVMKYALRRISSIVVRKENWALFEAQLCRVVMGYPNTLKNVARILVTYAHYGYPLEKGRLARVCNGLILEHVPLGNQSEVAWSLWLCKELKLTLTAEAVKVISRIQSSPCAIIAMDLEKEGLTAKPLQRREWRAHVNAQGLYGGMWLLAYEAGVRGWIGRSARFIKADKYFAELARRDIHFYDPAARLAPLFSVTDEAKAELNLLEDASLFDNEREDISEFLQFKEDDSEYGDAAKTEEFSDIDIATDAGVDDAIENVDEEDF